MLSPGTGGLRLARAFGLALTAFTVSLLAHVARGGAAATARSSTATPTALWRRRIWSPAQR